MEEKFEQGGAENICTSSRDKTAECPICTKLHSRVNWPRMRMSKVICKSKMFSTCEFRFRSWLSDWLAISLSPVECFEWRSRRTVNSGQNRQNDYFDQQLNWMLCIIRPHASEGPTSGHPWGDIPPVSYTKHTCKRNGVWHLKLKLHKCPLTVTTQG